MNEVGWPKPNPAWGRLVEQAWRALERLQNGGRFEAMRSESGEGAGVIEEISSLTGTEAILDLRDRVPEWARNIDWVGALYESLDEVNQIELLESTNVEIKGGRACASLIAKYAKEVEDAIGIAPVRHLSPVATATLVSTLTRAQLLPDPPSTSKLAIDERLIATLIFQSRVLTDDALVTNMKIHPYVLYQIRRSLWLAGLTFEGSTREAIGVELDRTRETTLEITETLLARSQIGGVRDGEIVALVFCAAALALGPPDPRYVIEALSVAAAGQSSRGDWPQGRRIGQHLDPDTGDHLVVSTHEVGLAFAEAMLWLAQVPGASSRLKEDAPGALQMAVDYLRESRVEFTCSTDSSVDENPLVVGWTSTHVYGHTHIDTRATAAALRLTVATRAVAEQIRSERALEEFEEVWDPAVDHTPSYLEWDQYKEHSEPDGENPILKYLGENFVDADRSRKQEDPRPWARIPAMSAILFGPPGTTKTTIVKAMAQGLGWPLVTLSPGTFIRDGLENVERRAVEVFSHLRDLRGVVVLFDECDELFRKRRGVADDDKETGNENARSISAFMTASMLPKLQGLRDNGQIFFVIATNYIEDIDPAAKRIGRIDRIVGVGWPDMQQREKIIKQTLATELSRNQMRKPLIKKVVTQLADKTHYCVRGELVELARGMAVEIRIQGKNARPEVVDTLGPIEPSIDPPERAAFRESAKARSACHRPNVGEMKE